MGGPPHEVYIEPFLGAEAIMRQKRPALLNIGLDLDAAVIARFNDEAADIAFRRCASHLQFQQGDGVAFSGLNPFTGNELVYCDSPYMPRNAGPHGSLSAPGDPSRRRILPALFRQLSTKCILLSKVGPFPPAAVFCCF
jgi:hypothetical protein